jgi:hypothetical protein
MRRAEAAETTNVAESMENNRSRRSNECCRIDRKQQKQKTTTGAAEAVETT